MTELKKALESCRATEDRYRRIFENTGTAMMISEDDGTISIVNTEFERMTGYRKNELEAKKTWMDIIHKEDLDLIRETHRLGLIRFEKNPRNTGPENYNFRVVDRLQNIKYVQVTACLIPGTRQNIVSMMDISDMKKIHDAVERSEKDLTIKSRELQELNTALEVLLRKRENDRKDLERSVSSNIENMILPHLLDLKKRLSRSEDIECVKIIEANLREIALPFAQRLSADSRKLTLREIQVAGLIRNGKTTKEIAELLGVSKGAIDTHRHLIRRKIGLNKKRINLQSYLASISL
jgi:PAS domain S-box-containing protein